LMCAHNARSIFCLRQRLYSSSMGMGLVVRDDV
jgi:hypothetical protein